jgi:hypothetical protein
MWPAFIALAAGVAYLSDWSVVSLVDAMSTVLGFRRPQR